MGLWTLKLGFDGTFERIETELVSQFRVPSHRRKSARSHRRLSRS